MQSFLKLQNGDSVHCTEDPQALSIRFNASRRDGTLIKVELEDGSIWINPHALISLAPHETADEPRIAA